MGFFNRNKSNPSKPNIIVSGKCRACEKFDASNNKCKAGQTLNDVMCLRWSEKSANFLDL
ncbi:hypothetical protein FACS1894217_13400 [Clostridia bacterium]|nr:hypothetical protein FACS1894217_13400 [Clostridia bacterium]